MPMISLRFGPAVAALAGFVAALAAASLPARAAEIAVGPETRVGLDLTVYGNGLALVKDRRNVALAKGANQLAFPGVPSGMMPETVSLEGAGVSVIERRYEFDLLTPDALLKRSVGQQVGIVRTHPATGEETIERATVLAASDGVVLKTESGRIETKIPERLVFYSVPGGLRPRPTLVAVVDSAAKAKRALTLQYLTGGVTWRADYTAVLDETDERVSLEAWATVTNTTGAAFAEARLKLVAGDVFRAPRAFAMTEKAAEGMVASRAAAPAADPPVREALGDVHLYALPRPVTLGERETKQIALLTRPTVKVERTYVTRGGGIAFGGRPGEAPATNPSVHIAFENSGDGAAPLPRGVVRVYRRDSAGESQFVGEMGLGHTPVGGQVELMIGRAFDITVQRRQTDFQRPGPPKNAFEARYAIKLQNARAEAATVKVIESFPGEWQIYEESLPHARDGRDAVWNVAVPAKGSTELAYRVRVKQ